MHPRITPTLFALLLSLVARGQDHVSHLTPRVILEKSLEASLPPGHDPGRLVLKVVDDAGDAELEIVDAVLASHPGATRTRMIRIADHRLAEMRREGERNTGTRLADLRQLHWVHLRADTDAAEVLSDLLALDAVENAYAQVPPVVAGDILPCATPNFAYAFGNPSGYSQGYRLAAPGGIDSVQGELLPNGTAAGVTIADIEFAWNLNHEDLMVNGPGALLGPPWAPGTISTDHGTAVVGVLSADRDGGGSGASPGIIGIADGATLRVVAAQTSVSGANVPAAILTATLGLSRGDVILVELQQGGPNYFAPTQHGSLPMEYFDAEFFAIRQATALGIHVVEAAGNGAQDFDSTDATGGAGVAVGHPTYTRLQPGSPGYRESGAILVGAGSDFVPHIRLAFSNHGTRVDSYSWGQNVFTLGYGVNAPTGFVDPFPCLDPNGQPDPNQFYTAGFSGTSSASPIVAGALGILESTHVATWGDIYHPRAARGLLRTTGTASASPVTDRIGRQPDLKDQLALVAVGPNAGFVSTGPSGQFSPNWAREVASAGDVNGDGVGDFIVASWSVDNGAIGDAGRVDVLCGRTSALLRRWQGTSFNQRLGFSVDGIGDIDLDGLDDVVISDAMGNGNVYVYSVMSGALLYSYFGTSGQLGYIVAGCGSLDGDPWPEIVMASPSGGTYGYGYVRVYSGASGWPMYAVDGTVFGEFYGTALAGPGDVNGDGKNDLVVGANRNPTGGPDTGAAYVYSGPNGALIHTLNGSSGERFGWSVGGAGDRDGDGQADLLIGAPSNDVAGTNTGAVYVVSGATGNVMTTIHGSVPNAEFGRQVDVLNDWDGDMTPDFLVAEASSSVHVISGATLATLQSYSGLNGLAGSIAALGDLDGDGLDEFIAGAAGAYAPGTFSTVGRSVVFFAPSRNPSPTPPTLVANQPTLSASAGGSSAMMIRAGAANAGASYVLVAGTSGRWPGTTLPNGALLPINVDATTSLVLAQSNNPPFTGFIGTLDGAGDGFPVFGSFNPGYLVPAVGLSIDFAAVTFTLGFVSDPVSVTIIP